MQCDGKSVQIEYDPKEQSKFERRIDFDNQSPERKNRHTDPRLYNWWQAGSRLFGEWSGKDENVPYGI